MFTAILLLCFSWRAECMYIRDVRGPYETLSRCEARLEEIAEYLHTAPDMPPFKIATKKCKSDMGELT